MKIARYTMFVTVTMTGVESHRIRRYEAAGLVSPTRSDGKHRMFSDADIEVIREIEALTRRGVNFAGVRHIMGLRRGGE
ncbi:MerR family transcriptional regulator [Dehalogenimonas sp. THU2]|uniref:MerR family transcriptional regulator n=1 Tax=Dehalogenimonas sp. THU2 TaxID=3151121 RepID=UPI003218B0D6